MILNDNELRTILSNSVRAWNEKDETMQDYIVQLFQEAALMSDDDSTASFFKNLETLQDFVRENILPFIMDETSDGEEDDNVSETTVRQVATSVMQLLEQQKQTINCTSVDASSCSSTVDLSLQQVSLGQETRPFTMRAMLKEDETAAAPAPAAVPPKDAAHGSDPYNTSKKEKLTRRQDKRKQKLASANKQQQQQSKTKKQSRQQENEDNNTESTGEEFVEDDATAWQECLQEGRQWGGRGHGGRGEYAAAVNSVKSNIHLTNITISLPPSSSNGGGGGDLLQNATMDIQRGHRYGLIGRNGCGKSTLLHRLANFQIPGMPTDMRILLVQQQVEGSDTDTPLQVLLQADTERTRLMQEQQRLEKILDSEASAAEEGASSSNDTATNKNDDGETTTLLAEAAERWSDIAVELEAIEAEKAEERGLEILRGLQFTPKMLASPTSQLSGGWRMRLALAKSLFVPGVDLLLYDECTNHLDLAGLDWLMNHLNNNNSNKSRNNSDKKNKSSSSSSARNEDRTLIVVSHDRTFLNAVCTDIMHMEHQKLTYHPGNYADYERTLEEKAARDAQILDASARQRSKAQAFVQKQQQQANKKSADPNKQRQAKMIREKKIDRIGNYREDGKRYKQFSLATLSEDSIRLAEKVEVKAQEAVVQMYFPNPSWPPGIGPNDDIVRMENLSFGYINENGDINSSKPLLNNVTASLHRGSKVALVGKNGAGKTSLMKLIAGELVLTNNPTSRPDVITTATTVVASHGGEFWRHGNLRIGHVTQYSVEELEQAHASKTVVEYAEERLKSGKASASIVAKHGGNVRQYLGAFGLGGRHALQTIGKLSGGERMRLCFATVLAEEPHLLAMDESTNHVDIETLDSMSRALHAYEGSVLMVSHNQGFLSGFCKELWVIEDCGRLTVNHSDTDSFDEIFSQYRSAVAAAEGQSLADKRRQKASLAKKASGQQRSGVRKNTALL